MNIQTLRVGLLSTCCYVLSPEEGEECLVIDPGAEPETVRRAMGSRRLAGILLTHGHFDHIGGVSGLMAPGVRLFIHPLDAPMLSDPVLNAGRGLLRRDVTAPPPTDEVREGDALTLAGLEIQVLHTPGHTPGGVCYRIGDSLFTGDTLFHNGWGRTDLPGGDQEQLFASLRRVVPLARHMPFYPGH